MPRSSLGLPRAFDGPEAQEVGCLFDFITDVGDIRDELAMSQRIEYEQEVTTTINHLDEMGLAVFCGRYHRKLNFPGGKDLDWLIAIVTITANTDPRIVRRAEGIQLLPALVPKKQPYSQ